MSSSTNNINVATDILTEIVENTTRDTPAYETATHETTTHESTIHKTATATHDTGTRDTTPPSTSSTALDLEAIQAGRNEQLERFRREQQALFEGTYVVEDPPHDTTTTDSPTALPSGPGPVNLKRRANTQDPASETPNSAKKRKPNGMSEVTDNSNSEMSTTPSKKSKVNGKAAVTDDVDSSGSIGSVTHEADPPTRRSDRIKKKRSAPDDLPAEDSPLSKKAKTATMTGKGKGKAPASPNGFIAPPPRTRQSGITSLLRQTKKLPKKQTPSKRPVIKREKTSSVKAEDEDTTSEPSDSEAESDDQHAGPSKKSKAKKKKEQPAPAIPTDFVGTSSGNGSSIEKPANGTLDEPWPCGNRGCTSGMTWLPRSTQDGKEGLGRKSVSHLFGRNKAATRLIDDDVWHTYCRKCYQRSTYKMRGMPRGLFGWHITNVQIQLNRLKIWRPDATFTVQLSKNMLARSDEWHRLLRANDGDKDIAQAEYDNDPRWAKKAPNANKKNKNRPATVKDEQAFPVELVDQFVRDCCGTDFDYDRVDQTITYIENWYAAETLTQMPPLEILIHKAGDDEEVNDPAGNYAQWVKQCDEQPIPTIEADDDEQIKAEDDTDDDDHKSDAGDEDIKSKDDEDGKRDIVDNTIEDHGNDHVENGNGDGENSDGDGAIKTESDNETDVKQEPDDSDGESIASFNSSQPNGLPGVFTPYNPPPKPMLKWRKTGPDSVRASSNAALGITTKILGPASVLFGTSSAAKRKRDADEADGSAVKIAKRE